MTNPLQNVDGRRLYAPPYDNHLWTIPIEYRGSITVFVTLLALSKVCLSLRCTTLVGMIMYALWQNRWDVCLFLSGTLFAQLSLLVSLPPSENSFKLPASLRHLISSSATALLIRLIVAIALLASLYLLSFQDEGYHASPEHLPFIGHYTPASYEAASLTQRFWLSIGAFLFVLCLVLCPTLQHPFTTAVPQYLGRISYALYMVHGPVSYTFGMRILVGKDTKEPPIFMDGGLEVRQQFWGDDADGWTYSRWFAVAAVVNTVVCFWLADLFWRFVDLRCVVFVKWLESCVWVREEHLISNFEFNNPQRQDRAMV